MIDKILSKWYNIEVIDSDNNKESRALTITQINALLMTKPIKKVVIHYE